MIIERYLFKELSLTLVAVTTVLFLIFVASWFARLLAEVSTGNIQANVIFLLLAFKSIDSLMILLPLALYLAVLLAFGRLYKDSEMTAMLACGVSPLKILRLVVLFAGGFALLVGFISLYLGPWAIAERLELQSKMEASTGLEGVAAGQFRPLMGGRMVFYAERLSEDGKSMENIFVEGQRDGVMNVVVAQRAYRLKQAGLGGSYLVLEDGFRYEGNPGSGKFRIIEFAEHGLLIEERQTVLNITKSMAKPTAALWRSSDPKDLAELQWRLAMPLSAVLLSLLAVYISRTNPRQGRFGRFFIGVLLYVVYSNLLGVARTWMEKGQIDPALGMWWVHATVALVLGVVVWRQWRAQRRAARLLAG